MQNLCIFGDSITWGAIDAEGGGWVQRLRKYIDMNRLPFEVYSLGVCGDTSEGLLARFEGEAKARNPYIIIIAIGTNDAAYRSTIDNNVVPFDQFKSNILSLLEKAKIFTSKIIIIGLPKVDESKTVPLADSSTGKCYVNSNIKKYSNALQTIAQENNVPIIDIFEILTEKDFDDGLHPNSAGHEKLFQYIKGKIMHTL